MRSLLLFMGCLLLPRLALAHGGDGFGFMAGLYHPVLGLDHLIAMISVGIVSAQLGGKAIWSVPLTFVSVMALGGLAGLNYSEALGFEVSMTLIELGILLSVIILGLAIALDKRISTPLAISTTGFFGFFHGYAHGSEIPDLSLSTGYIAGFMVGTSLLHISGVAIGMTAERIPHGKSFLRYGGAAIFGIGVHMAYQMLFEF